MEVTGHCRKCGEWFDAHWHVMATGKEKCPKCGAFGRDLVIRTDESEELKEVR